MEKREVDAFFAGLPADAFTRVESLLREVLMLAVESMPSGLPFPLVEWIERRLNDDITISQGDTGLPEISSQHGEVQGREGASQEGHTFHSPSPKYDEFFNKFPQDRFTQAENNLRDTIFDFLVRWNRPELPTLRHLTCAQSLITARKALLQDIPLVEWIWRRVGKEIVISNSQPNISYEEVVLTQEGREVVLSKWHDAGEPPILLAKSKEDLPDLNSASKVTRSRRGGKRHRPANSEKGKSLDDETPPEKHQKTG